jgi:hypothetical protein
MLYFISATFDVGTLTKPKVVRIRKSYKNKATALRVMKRLSVLKAKYHNGHLLMKSYDPKKVIPSGCYPTPLFEHTIVSYFDWEKQKLVNDGKKCVGWL